MERAETGREGVVVYRRVPIIDTGDQHGYAYLHIRGIPRDMPSHVIRVFLGDETVTATTGPEHPAFAGEATTYNSPPVPGAAVPAAAGRPLADEPGSYDVLVDVSDAVRRIGAADRADVALVMIDLKNRPLDASRFSFSDLTITRNR